jgi:hypothetical protein
MMTSSGHHELSIYDHVREIKPKGLTRAKISASELLMVSMSAMARMK